MMMRAFLGVIVVGLVIMTPITMASAQEPVADPPSPVERRLGALDRLPPGYLEIANEHAKQEKAKSDRALRRARRNRNPASMPRRNLLWQKPVVTVAFNGGNEFTRSLVEWTTREWTAAGDQFRFEFRDPDGGFRVWTEADTSPKADIRISFRNDVDGGYWSLIGIVATTARPNRPTMNFEYFEDDTRRYATGSAADWTGSYLHSTVLHEFGHALGLAHEHFHIGCQQEIKFDPDLGYVTTLDAAGALAPDASGRSPGANFYLLGPPNKWSLADAQFNLSAKAYVDTTTQYEDKYFSIPREGRFFDPSTQIDRRSVMMYVIEPFLLKSGVNSPCIGQGDGLLPSGQRFATRLSAGDVAFFRRNYIRRAWPRSGP